MPAIAVNQPFPIFTDADGQPLDDAYIYIGAANQNPVSNPITVYWDSALTIPASQPIRTSGGYPVRNGTPARFYANSDYSILVRDKNGAFVYTEPNETGSVSSELVTFLQSGTGAVQRTTQSKLRDVVSVKDFGAVGDGVTDDTVAIKAAINTGKSVYFPGGSFGSPAIYKISSTLNVGVQTIYSENTRNAIIKTSTSGINMVSLGSSSVMMNLQVDGGNVARCCVQVPATANRVSIVRVRASYAERGFELIDTQNSWIQETFAQYCDYNYVFDGTENCKVYHGIGNLDTAQRTVTPTTRNILCTQTSYGGNRSLDFYEGIYERGNNLNDHCVEVINSDVSFNNTELNTGGVATLKLTNSNAELYGTYFSMGANCLSVQADSASSCNVKGITVTGYGAGPSWFTASGPFSDKGLLTHTFEFSSQGWTGSSGGSVVYNSTAKRIDVTTTASAQGARYFYNAPTPRNPAPYSGLYYDIEVVISNISTGNPVYLNATLASSPFNRGLGNLNVGYNRIIVAADALDSGGFNIYANEAVAKTWGIKYFSAKLI